MQPDEDRSPGHGARRAARRPAIAAWFVGLLLSVATVFVVAALATVLNREECSGEYRPFLGSGKQDFAVHGCLARNAGPLIEIKKRLGIYDPRWINVIR